MRYRLLPAFISILFLNPNTAFAGAWTQAQDGIQLIVTGNYYSAEKMWDNQGQKQSQPTYSKYELNPYIEYGLRDDLTLGANILLDRAHQDAAAGSGRTNFDIGDSEFFLRKRLINSSGYVMSVEPMIKLPSPENSSSQPRVGSSHPDLGLSIANGYGFSAWGLNHFADLDVQYRHRLGPSKDQVKISGTVGIGLTQRWMLMPQTFLTYRTSHNQTVTFTQSSSDDYNLIRLQLSAVYKMTDSLSLQMGGYGDIDGKNAGIGRGVLIALWKQF